MSWTQVTVTSMQVAVRYRRNVHSLSIDMSAESRTTIFDRHIDRNIGRVSVETSADISVICRQTHLDRYVGRLVDRHIGGASVDMSTDT